jgi:hypothetical protein
MKTGLRHRFVARSDQSAALILESGELKFRAVNRIFRILDLQFGGGLLAGETLHSFIIPLSNLERSLSGSDGIVQVSELRGFATLTQRLRVGLGFLLTRKRCG